VAQGWVSTSGGRHLLGRRKKDTAPELALRRALHAAGARFRLQRRLAPGCTPDIVLPGRRLAVFVDGCFWHGCPAHGRKKPWTGPNASLREDKMARNRERDVRSTNVVTDLGWRVVRVWECEVRADGDGVCASAARRSRRRRLWLTAAHSRRGYRRSMSPRALNRASYSAR
jgi:DNA mismatch endonuclease (patch repair protein)